MSMKRDCPNCGSDRVDWTAGPAMVSGGDGSVFSLGCIDCSETLAVVTEGEMCAALNRMGVFWRIIAEAGAVAEDHHGEVE